MAELSVFDQAIEQYPILKGLGLTSKVSPATDNNKLEFWPPGEPGAEGRLRPREFPIDKPGVELYGDRATPLDVLGDVTSHHLITADPKIADYYRRFTEFVDARAEEPSQRTASIRAEKLFKSQTGAVGLPGCPVAA